MSQRTRVLQVLMQPAGADVGPGLAAIRFQRRKPHALSAKGCAMVIGFSSSVVVVVVVVVVRVDLVTGSRMGVTEGVGPSSLVLACLVRLSRGKEIGDPGKKWKSIITRFISGGSVT